MDKSTNLQRSEGDPGGGSERPTCGNCCNAQKHPDPSRALAGRVLCTALPPGVVVSVSGPSGPQGVNVYPEMDPAKLGCTVFWGVQFSILHLMARAAAEILDFDDDPPHPSG